MKFWEKLPNFKAYLIPDEMNKIKQKQQKHK